MTEADYKMRLQVIPGHKWAGAWDLTPSRFDNFELREWYIGDERHPYLVPYCLYKLYVITGIRIGYFKMLATWVMHFPEPERFDHCDEVETIMEMHEDKKKGRAAVIALVEKWAGRIR